MIFIHFQGHLPRYLKPLKFSQCSFSKVQSPSKQPKRYGGVQTLTVVQYIIK